MKREELAIEQLQIMTAIEQIIGKNINPTELLLLVNRCREWDKNQEKIINLENRG